MQCTILEKYPKMIFGIKLWATEWNKKIENIWSCNIKQRRMSDYIFNNNELVGYYDGNILRHCSAQELKQGHLLHVGQRLYSMISSVVYKNGRVHVKVAYRPRLVQNTDVEQVCRAMQDFQIAE